MFILIRSISIAILKGIVTLAVGAAILGMVARNCNPREAVAYIHVSAQGVDVTVGEFAYRIESLYETPIVCVLPPGRHVLRMSRGDAVLFEAEFTLEPAREVVLCAWEQPREEVAGTPNHLQVRGLPRATTQLTALTRRPRP